MKRIIVFMLCICVVIPSLMFSSYAETLQGETDENITEGRQKEYDSVYFSDEDMETISYREIYESAIKYYGDESKASSKYGFDINILNDNTGFVKIYWGYDPRENILSGNPISDATLRAERLEYIKILNEEKYLHVIYGLGPNISNIEEYEYYAFRLPDIRFYDYVINADLLFESVESTKSLGNVEILQTYVFQCPHAYIPDAVGPSIIYFVTDKGDYILYNCEAYNKSNWHLLKKDTFIDITRKMYDYDSFEDTYLPIEPLCHIEGFFDLTDCIVGENIEEYNVRNDIEYPFLKNDPNFFGYYPLYYFAKGVGYENSSQLNEAIRNSGLKGTNILQVLTHAGCTTYAECRAYIDSAIEAKKNPPPVTSTPSGGGDMMQNNPADSGDGKSNAFLFWLIPSVLVVLAAAVAIFILKKKKKA